MPLGGDLETLSERECLDLLGSVTIGRVGVSIGALPAIFPVNFRLVGGDVVFRTGPGTKLDAALDRAVVAFEADTVDALYREGWSVLVVGQAEQVADPVLAERLGAAVRPWAPGRRDHVVRITASMVSGRRITHSDRTAAAGPSPA